MQKYIVVLSGCQRTIWRIYTTGNRNKKAGLRLFYQDVNEQFEGYTQRIGEFNQMAGSCFIRMSMNNLKDIHNLIVFVIYRALVVLSGCQWTIWRIYTTDKEIVEVVIKLFYQDVNEQFEGYTQRLLWSRIWRGVVLSGCQWTIWRIYTTTCDGIDDGVRLFYQDVNEQFEGYTQPHMLSSLCRLGCFIRMSMNNLKDIHNVLCYWVAYIQLFYQDFNEQFCCKSTKNPWNLQIYWKIFWYFRKK